VSLLRWTVPYLEYEPKKKSNLQKLEFAMNSIFMSTGNLRLKTYGVVSRREGMIDQLTQAGVSVNKDEFMAQKR
jgi:ParB family chromosome partitioning protein